MKKSGAELGQQAQAATAAAGARAEAAAARGALRGMRQSPGRPGARGGPGAPDGARGAALRLPHPAPFPPRRTPEDRGRRFPGGGGACPARRLPKKSPPRGVSRVSGSPASASYMKDPRGQIEKKKKRKRCSAGAVGERRKPLSSLAKQLDLGVGRSRQLKKKKKKSRHAIYLFFLYISLVTGSPRIPCKRRRWEGG